MALTNNSRETPSLKYWIRFKKNMLTADKTFSSQQFAVAVWDIGALLPLEEKVFSIITVLYLI